MSNMSFTKVLMIGMLAIFDLVSCVRDYNRIIYQTNDNENVSSISAAEANEPYPVNFDESESEVATGGTVVDESAVGGSLDPVRSSVVELPDDALNVVASDLNAVHPVKTDFPMTLERGTTILVAPQVVENELQPRKPDILIVEPSGGPLQLIAESQPPSQAARSESDDALELNIVQQVFWSVWGHTKRFFAGASQVPWSVIVPIAIIAILASFILPRAIK